MEGRGYWQNVGTVGIGYTRAVVQADKVSAVYNYSVDPSYENGLALQDAGLNAAAELVFLRGAFRPRVDTPSSPLRQRVLANISASRSARQSSTFDIHIGLEEVANIRASHAVSAGKNIAFADFHLNMRAGRVLGVSGHTSRPGFAPIPDEPLFATFNVRHPRAFDSEVLILEDLARQFPDNESGTVRLFSERPFCDSCLHAIDQFEVLNPNIRVISRAGGQ